MKKLIIATALLALTLSAEEPKPIVTTGVSTPAVEIATLKAKLAKAEMDLQRMTDKANFELSVCNASVQGARQHQEQASCIASGGTPSQGPQGTICQPKAKPAP